MLKKTILYLTVLVVFVLLAILYLHSYNRYFFPLGRLYGELERGQQYVEIEKKFLEYYDKYKADDEIQLDQGHTKGHIMKGPISETRHLFIYHVSFLDDVQLQVLFDSDGKANEIIFIGD